MEADTVEVMPANRAAQPPSPPTPVAAAARAVMTVRQAALARFTAAETHLLDMAARYGKRTWDCTTTKGLNEAKAARLEMRQEGRYLVQNTVEAVTDELNELKGDVKVEGARLIKIIEAAEKAAHDAITAEEAAIEERRARKRRMQEAIDTIKGYVALAKDKGSEDIAKGIAYTEALDVSVEKWGEDFAPTAAAAVTATLAGLRDLHAAALVREEEARVAEENRLAEVAKQAAAQRVMDDLSAMGGFVAEAVNTVEGLQEAITEAEGWPMTAERWGNMLMAAKGTQTQVLTELRGMLAVEEQRLAQAATQAAADAAAAEAQAQQVQVPAPPAPPAVLEAAAIEVKRVYGGGWGGDMGRRAVASPAPAPAEATGFANLDDEPVTSPSPAPAAAEATEGVIVITARDSAELPGSAPVAAPEVPEFKLGDINALFGAGFTMTSAFVSDTLGVDFTKSERGAVMFTKSQRRRVVAQFIEHACAVADVIDQEV